MKKLVSLMVICLTFFVGCSNQENSITGPKADGFEKESAPNTLSSDNTVSTTSSVAQLINGAIGGWIKLSANYVDLQGRTIKVDASLFIPQGSFVGTKTITMTADFSNASVEFYPSMQFNKWLSLNVQFLGLPLNQMGYSSNSKVDFVYFGDDGRIYPLMSKSVLMNHSQGSLKVSNGWLNHFSRYGFVR
jgi:hypothetical protein